jgi:hypothetical protein
MGIMLPIEYSRVYKSFKILLDNQIKPMLMFMLILAAAIIATIAMAIDMNSPSDVDEEFNRIFDVK